MKKMYLGDSVYVEFDGYGLWLTTENGLPTDPSNKIYLEPVVFENLKFYVEKGLKEVNGEKESGEGAGAKGDLKKDPG